LARTSECVANYCSLILCDFCSFTPGKLWGSNFKQADFSFRNTLTHLPFIMIIYIRSTVTGMGPLLELTAIIRADMKRLSLPVSSSVV
jgi:hypothetical protein